MGKSRHVFLTGATGFLGTALVESILRTQPDTTVYALIRPGRATNVTTRLKKDLLSNNCFDTLRTDLGQEAFDALTMERVQAVAGNVGSEGLGLDTQGYEILGRCDTVIHSAATVSFDAPFDSAVEINLLGPSRVLATYTKARGNDLPGHMISVSTAYVAGSRKGDALELSLRHQPHYPNISWQEEVRTSREFRATYERRSREPEQLEIFRVRASRELGAAGIALLAERAEKLRIEWVKDQLIALGRKRAQSLGWPDAYAMTKALGERALEDQIGNIPISVVRPSIIESALASPTPGWIRGFRMAEPIIISYARGLLKDFPGVPEGVIDVIPVDLVVGAILAVATAEPAPGMSFYHSASGSTNPLRYRELVRLLRVYFAEHPLYDERGQAIKIPEWTYPGRGSVEAALSRSRKALDLTSRVVESLPLRGTIRNYQDKLAETTQGIDRAQSYVELYGAYAECEARYQIDNLLGLRDRLPSDFPLIYDPQEIDWEPFVLGTHLPSIVAHARARTSPRPSSTKSSRDARIRKSLLTGDKLAVFDLENTLIAANVVDSFSWLATASLSGTDRPRMLASLLMEAPTLLALDTRDRSDFLRYFYRRYRNANEAEITRLAPEFLTGYLLRKSFPQGIARVRAHRRVGHRTVCITGALSIIIEPLRPLFDDVVALEMPAKDGVLTGELPGTLPIGEARADVLRSLSRKFGIALENTVAYADSTSDLPLLELAGQAVAVNPDSKLRQLARRRGWLIENWTRMPGYSPVFLPIGSEL